MQGFFKVLLCYIDLVVGSYKEKKKKKSSFIHKLQRHAAPLPDLCRLDPDPGPCGSRATRWFFDVQGSGDCAQFTWGGCRGNENNFLSIR